MKPDIGNWSGYVVTGETYTFAFAQWAGSISVDSITSQQRRPRSP